MEYGKKSHIWVGIVKREKILEELTGLVSNLLNFFLLFFIFIGTGDGNVFIWEKGVGGICPFCQLLLVFFQLLVHCIADFGLSIIHILNSSHINSLLQVCMKGVDVIRR